MPDVTLPLTAAWVNAAILGAAGLLTWFDNGRTARAFFNIDDTDILAPFKDEDAIRLRATRYF